MKTIWLLVFSIFLLACGNDTKQDVKTTEPVKDYLLQENYISTATAANHEKIKDVKGDINLFTTYINNLSDSLITNAFAIDYLNNCNFTSDTDKDSAYRMFNRHFYVTLNKLTDSLETKYKLLLDLLAKDTTTAELTCFKNNLTACGVGIFSTEGNFYVDVLADYFYDNFKNRVPDATKEYLAIRKDEMKQGFSEDAGLLISFDELYKRIKRWEAFLTKYPNTNYRNEVVGYYNLYVGVLMTGMDNSRLFDFDSNTLLPEIKTLYEKIEADNPASPTTKLFTAYYAFLARHDFKQNDSIVTFAQANNIPSMLAVQPPTR